MRSRKLLAWHPLAADEAWLRAEARRLGRGALSRMLDEAIADLREKYERPGARAQAGASLVMVDGKPEAMPDWEIELLRRQAAKE
jgi:hypothetical protein